LAGGLTTHAHTGDGAVLGGGKPPGGCPSSAAALAAGNYFYPRSFCPVCQSADVEWTDVSGRGRLVSYVINHRPLPPADLGVPQVIALVELEEGGADADEHRRQPGGAGRAAARRAPSRSRSSRGADLKVPVFRLDSDR